MRYTVTAERIADTGQGIIKETVHEEHGFSESAAEKLADELAKDEENHVFVSFYRSSDGQHGYLNRDGHAITGKRW
jgi:hypothetical protein